MANSRSRSRRGSAPTVRNRKGEEAVKVTESMNGEFDALLARMQTAKARAGTRAAFNASSEQLGKAAVAPARKRE